jgi:Ca2+-binding RTX toxin-like protein
MATYNGTSAPDIYDGTSSADIVHGNGGDDTLNGLGGNDSLYGDAGNDGLYGGIGNDRIWGGIGVDALFGGDGADQLYGEAGDDWLQGGAGNDYIHGGSGNDRLRGDDGDDTLAGAGGDNDVRGGAGNDIMLHSASGLPYPVGGKAFFDGGSGRDTLQIDYTGDHYFGEGPDVADRAGWIEINMNIDKSGTIYYAGHPTEGNFEQIGTFTNVEVFSVTPRSTRLSVTMQDDATVIGGDADDKLEGRRGDQDFTGGKGADAYQFLWRPGFEPNHDVVHGFSLAEGDTIAFNSQFEGDLGTIPAPLELTIEEIGGHTIYTSVEIATGEVAHTLNVDAVGLPPPADWYFLG